MFAHIDELEQVQRLQQDEAALGIYFSGLTYVAKGHLPAMAEITYLQGYCEGMKHLKIVTLFPITSQEEQKELPLVCGQCAYLNNGKCAIKEVTRNSNSYACERIKVDCPF